MSQQTVTQNKPSRQAKFLTSLAIDVGFPAQTEVTWSTRHNRWILIHRSTDVTFLGRSVSRSCELLNDRGFVDLVLLSQEEPDEFLEVR